MKVNTLGEILKYYRIKYKLGQEAICAGICSVSTLSKIENGDKAADSLMAECLLGRLGKSVFQFELFLNDEDYERWKLRECIEKLEEEKKWEEAVCRLWEYKEQVSGTESVHMQYILYQEAKCMTGRGENPKAVEQKLVEALLQTKENFIEELEKGACYHPMELEIVMLLLESNWSGFGNYGIEEVFFELYGYVKRIYTEEAYEQTGTEMLLRMIRYAEKKKDYEQVIQYADRAVEVLSRGRGTDYFGELHFYKAKAIEALYHESNEWSEQEQLCRRECLMAFHMYQIMAEQEELEKVKGFCKERLQWQITG